MPALDHAIERVKIHADGSVSISIINGGEPVGICGSGLVDLLSELRRTGGMNEQGRFPEEHSDFILRNDITMNESDVNELAQAKGANAAGLRVIADVYGVPLERIDRLYLAGGFSKHIDVEAARRIGLIPDLPDDRIIKVGNAALEGATIALLSRKQREKLEDLVKRVEHVRLETHPHFFDFFVEGCQFAPFGSTR
jgi:uncharacterized 2Fe-2S/4Fe-4S cluster protein (DUF4445 family)